MHCFEIFITQNFVSNDRGPYVLSDQLGYVISEEAEELLETILSPYNRDPMWYLEGINFGHPPAPWALVCLDHEYALGGHIATTRLPDTGITFAPYNEVPDPMPDNFVPGVGILVFGSKAGLERSAGASPLFAVAWDALKKCSTESAWLVILDPLSEEWLAEVLPGDHEHWLSRRRG